MPSHSYLLDADRIKEVLFALAVGAGFFTLLVKIGVGEAFEMYSYIRRLWRQTTGTPLEEHRPDPSIGWIQFSRVLCHMLEKIAFEKLKRTKPNVVMPLPQLNNVYAMKLLLTEVPSWDHCTYLAGVLRTASGDLDIRVFLADERKGTFHTFTMLRMNPWHNRLLLCIAGTRRDARFVFRKIVRAEDAWNKHQMSGGSAGS